MSIVKVVVIATLVAVVLVVGVVVVQERHSDGDGSTRSDLAEALSGFAGKRAARASDFAGSACATSAPTTLAVAAGGSCSVALPSKVGRVTACSGAPGAQIRMAGTDYPATVAKGVKLACPIGYELRVYDERTVVSFVCAATSPCQFTLLGKAD